MKNYNRRRRLPGCRSTKTILEANPDIEVTATGSDGEEACFLCTESIFRIFF